MSNIEFSAIPKNTVFPLASRYVGQASCQIRAGFASRTPQPNLIQVRPNNYTGKLSTMRNENLWAPWRMAYLQDLTDNEDEAGRQPSGPPSGPPSEPPTGPKSEQSPAHSTDPSNEAAKSCFLCDAIQCQPDTDDARQKLVLLIDDRGMLMLNKYPYTNGHLLICAKDHVGQLADLTADQRAGLMELTALAEQLLKTAINPQGLNVGINLGRAAGAGVPGHLHIHVLPRWVGDTNFMQTVGQIRVIPQALDQSYDHLAAVLAKLGNKLSDPL